MGDKRPYKPRKLGAGRKPLKPDYDAVAILQEQQMQAAVALYEEDNSLQSIADNCQLVYWSSDSIDFEIGIFTK